jgi:hypothetical protein
MFEETTGSTLFLSSSSPVIINKNKFYKNQMDRRAYVNLYSSIY